MKKSFILPSGQALGITPDVVKRIVCKNDWWSTCPRVFDEQACGVFDLSYPEGYQVGRKEIDYEYEHLLRLSQLF